MSSSQEIETQFWKSLKSDRTMMLGLDGNEDGHARPMTAQFERERGPIWFFTAKDHAIVQKLTGSKRAIATFASKGHDLFATVHGSISVDTKYGIDLLRLGTRGEKTTQSWLCSVSMRIERKSGWMDPASSRE